MFYGQEVANMSSFRTSRILTDDAGQFVKVLASKGPPPWQDDNKDGHYMFAIGDNLTSRFNLKVKMIKRRFYKIDHGDRDDASDSSSSSSDFEQEAEATEESEEHVIPEVDEDNESSSTSSGYKSEDSSANDVDVNSSGQLFSEDDVETRNQRQVPSNPELFNEHDSQVSERKSNLNGTRECLSEDLPSYIFKCKSVFKCRICPRIICLTEETLRAHLQSKRHFRSQKLLSEGRLKAMLNSDGEIENQEVSETQTNTMDNLEKNHKGQKQHKKRFRKKKRDDANTRKMGSKEGPAKRRRRK